MIFGFLAVLFIIVLILNDNTISTKTYLIETPLLLKQSAIKIALISDLHSTIHGKDQTILIEKIKNANPDLIVLLGDIFDDVAPMTGAKLLLAGISDLAPMYYVTGNHERWSRDTEIIRKELLSYGVIILSDAYAKIKINDDEIILAGIEDPAGIGKSGKKLYKTPDYDLDAGMEKAFRELDEIQLYKILLAHRPEKIETYKKYSFDLVLSGHTHGGQIRIPYILNGLYAPNQGFFPKYAGGCYVHGNLTHIIGRGLSIKPWLPRICNPPELVIININMYTNSVS